MQVYLYTNTTICVYESSPSCTMTVLHTVSVEMTIEKFAPIEILHGVLQGAATLKSRLASQVTVFTHSVPMELNSVEIVSVEHL